MRKNSAKDLFENLKPNDIERYSRCTSRLPVNFENFAKAVTNHKMDSVSKKGSYTFGCQ